MNPLRMGILGTGNIARQFAADLASAHRVVLRAVGSRNADRGREFAEAFSASTAHGDYDALLADDQVDAVYISLPNSLHCEWTIRALQAGKHVLCEKPLASSSDEVDRMFAAAHQNQRVLVEAFMYRSHPLLAAIKSAVDEGQIGRLQAIRANFCFRVRQPQGNIRFQPELAGGALMDVGVYCVSFSRFITGQEPDSISAVGHRHDSGVDGLVGGCLRFPGGVVSVFLCGLTAQNDNTVIVCGTDGYLQIPFTWKPPRDDAEFTIIRQPPPKMDQRKQPSPAQPKPPQVIRVSASNSLYGQEADDFAATVLDGAPPTISEADSRGNMRVVEQLRDMI